MKKMLYIFSAIFILAVHPPLFSQGNAAKANRGNQNGIGVIEGFAFDSLTQKPLQYVTVTVLNPADSLIVNGSLTDEKGYYRIEQIPEGSYLLKISFIGYSKIFVKNIIINRQNPYINIGKTALLPADIETDEIQVSGEKDAVTYNIDKKVINVSAMANVRGGTATDALRNVPAVNVDIDGNVSLRGSGNFQTLVDGKPSLMSGSDLLRQIPADLIDKIEIITNPSAKYDPDGTSGIINIIMKKQTNLGYNGLVSASAGTTDKYDFSANGNLKLDKTNINGSIEVNDRKNYPTSDLKRVIVRNDTSDVTYSDVKRSMNQHGYRLKLGSEYSHNEAHETSLIFDYGFYGFDRYFPVKYRTSTLPGEGYSFSMNNDVFDFGGNLLNVTLNHKWKFTPKKEELNTSFIYASFGGDFPQEVREFQTDSMYSNVVKNQFWNKVNLDQLRQIGRLTSDYFYNFSEQTKLEIGLLGEYKKSSSDYLRNEYDFITNIWNKNLLLSNENDYYHLISALYSTFSSEFSGINFQAGLRAEFYKRLYKQLTTKEDFGYEKFSLFPTLHLSTEIAKNHQIQLSYSRRVHRPHDTQLNPHPDYFDQYIVSTGNPALKPEYTDSYEFNYMFNTDFISLTAETFYRYSYDLISRILTLKSDGKIWLYPVNINDDKTYGVGLSGNLVFAREFRISLSGNYYTNDFTELVDGRNTARTINSFDGNITANIIPYMGAFIQLTGYYSGPKNQPNNGTMKEFYQVSLALRQEFLDRKLSVTLRAQDLFNSAKYVMSNETGGFTSYSNYLPERSVFVLSMSYIINDYKRTPRRDEGSEMEFQGGF